jgi:uncharacterized membrane protein YcaP (DUF421 family)
MNTVLMSVAIYFLLLLLFRVAGKRAVSEITSFDFVLLLIISEATQQALVGTDTSLTTAAIVIATLVLCDIGLSLVKQRSRKVDILLEGLPLILVREGRPLEERMRMSRVEREDILRAARESQGLRAMEEIGLAILETNGAISIIPERADPSPR